MAQKTIYLITFPSFSYWFEIGIWKILDSKLKETIVGKFLELVLVLPATNATSKRNFSKMKLINDLSVG